MVKEIKNEDEARKFLSGRALDIDRSKNAKTITNKIDEWKNKTNKVDLKGFDDTTRKQLSIKEISGATRGVNVMTDEADRLIKYLEPFKDKIYDKKSLENQMRSVFCNPNSFGSLGDYIYTGAIDIFWEQALIKGWIANNNRNNIINFIKRKYKVDSYRAEEVFNRIRDDPNKTHRLLMKINFGRK
jgi:hypothetical protein